MNKLSKKFIIGIVAILSISFFGSILFNTKFLEQYYLYKKKDAIADICDEFMHLLHQGYTSEQAIERIETSNKVIIAEIENKTMADNDKVNAMIQNAFQEKGIGFQRYWLWEEDYKKIFGGENKIRLYQQEKLNYNLLIDYVQINSSLYAITMIVPNVADAFDIANKFLIFVNFVTIIFSISFIIYLVKKITDPLQQFETFARHMQKNEFVSLDVQTKDELESVADSLNLMGNQITAYQQSLQAKHIQMEELIDNVAHELKTPIALIQLYAYGMKDGLDDGTFLATILEENHQMSSMVNRLLYISQMDKSIYEKRQIDLSTLLLQLVDKYSVLAKENSMKISASIEPEAMIFASDELIKSLFQNLIINAISYASGNEAIAKLTKNDSQVIVTIINEIDNDDLDLLKIWTPYYVGEKSRDKKISGTGLGLSIVNKICQTQNYTITCSLDQQKITFTVIFSKYI